MSSSKSAGPLFVNLYKGETRTLTKKDAHHKDLAVSGDGTLILEAGTHINSMSQAGPGTTRIITMKKEKTEKRKHEEGEKKPKEKKQRIHADE